MARMSERPGTGYRDKINFQLENKILNQTRFLVQIDLTPAMRPYLPNLRDNDDEYAIITDVASVSIYPPLQTAQMEVTMRYALPSYCKKYPKNASTIRFWDSKRNRWSQKGCTADIDDNYTITDKD